MRRYILIAMMFLLPLQWSWAAAAAVCQHESAGAHFGHHEHKHQTPSADHGADDAHEKTDGRLAASHPDCQACQGFGSGYPAAHAGLGHTWAADRYASIYSHYLPEPPLESLLRPPLSLVA